MSFYKLTDDKAFFVCICGKEYDVNIVDLKAGIGRIVLPRCECNVRTTMMANEWPEDNENIIKGRNRERQILTHTLFKRLVDADQLETDVVKNDIPLGCMILAKEFVLGETEEAPLNIYFVKAKKEKNK